MPKVVIDLRMVRGRLHGIARYALELCRRVPALAPGWELIGLAGPEGLPGDLGPLQPSIPIVRCTAGFLSPFEQPALLASLLKLRPTLFHATSFSLPALWPGRLVATLHDANHVAQPENYGPGRVAYYRLVVAPRAQRARALLTDSEFSREELARHLGLSPYRFQVILPGVDERYKPPSRMDVEEFLRRRGLPRRYFAAVGNTKAHKNLRLLAKLAEDLPAPIALLAGRGAAAELGFPSSTIELRDLPEEEMPLLYGGAEALLLPSKYEGFGLPALEAMACGCPVIASRASALPEVVGEAGVLLPPDDPAAWKEAVLRLGRDEALRRELAELGIERAARFSWEDCARKTFAAYERALGRQI